MTNQRDNPGVILPPPMVYAVIFLISLLIQKLIPINPSFLHSKIAVAAAIVFIFLFLIFAAPALIQFFRTKNSVITFKPANSLQTTGIYSISRNPMYVSLFFLYIGLSFLFGNWWTFVLLPVVIVIITLLFILPEERYLERAFGDSYLAYKEKVRRWF
ncbi:MAG: isoprenylcysteine carboxylmethyltransferase family protein [Bacteroidetes bacterium]|nr:isoprenylcysteine carboxylmethyltransferase family protein [Bacteroidota bacterium]MBS1931730.1 isoprenylcysteine carboxylmethyltransferase family protein [Bacteroidota bacterium]